jgi:hypothetical protein
MPKYVGTSIGTCHKCKRVMPLVIDGPFTYTSVGVTSHLCVPCTKAWEALVQEVETEAPLQRAGLICRDYCKDNVHYCNYLCSGGCMCRPCPCK